MQELKNTTTLVRRVLEEDKATRNNDMLLYLGVCRLCHDGIGTIFFGSVMRYYKDYHLPPFESVRRTRQKLQAENPELRADADVEAGRMLNEEIYREYARS